jgi:hypothetical protein
VAGDPFNGVPGGEVSANISGAGLSDDGFGDALEGASGETVERAPTPAAALSKGSLDSELIARFVGCSSWITASGLSFS